MTLSQREISRIYKGDSTITAVYKWNMLVWPHYPYTSLTLSDIERIEENLCPAQCIWEKYDMVEERLVDWWALTFSSWDTFTIFEYDNMISREVISSRIEDWNIYTIMRIHYSNWDQDCLYVNNPFNRQLVAVSAQSDNNRYTTLYSNMEY